MTRRPPISPDQVVSEGFVLHKAGRLGEAEACYRRVLSRVPTHARARYLLGTLLHQSGDPLTAASEIERAIKDDPGVPAMYVNLSGVYLALGRVREAVDAARKAVRLEPESPEAFFNLGEASRKIGDWEAAGQAFESYIRLRPADGAGYAGLGHVLKRVGRFDAAMVAFESAMTYAPHHVETHIGIADFMILRGWHNAALMVLDRIAQAAPANLDVLRRRGEINLALGHLATGWDQADEGRFGAPGGPTRQPAPPPYWQGEDISDKRLLIWNEQGPGDECLHASMLPDVLARTRSCIVACSARMAPVLARSFPALDVRAWDGRPPPLPAGEVTDLQISAGSLGRYLRRDFAHFPKHAGYLKADDGKRAILRRKYQALAAGKRIVGLAWKSTNALPGSSKTAELSRLGGILETPGVQFVNLQYGDVAAEIAGAREKFGVEIFQDPDVDAMSDIDGFFAQVAAMDLVISTSNTAVHVAGSMGVPTWLLLPAGRGALWYWFLRREDSPWYPSLRIIRASGADPQLPWESEPVARAGADLAHWAGASTAAQGG